MSKRRPAATACLAALAVAATVPSIAAAAGEDPVAGTQGAGVFINLTGDWIQTQPGVLTRTRSSGTTRVRETVAVSTLAQRAAVVSHGGVVVVRAAGHTYTVRVAKSGAHGTTRYWLGTVARDTATVVTGTAVSVVPARSGLGLPSRDRYVVSVIRVRGTTTAGTQESGRRLSLDDLTPTLQRVAAGIVLRVG